jgi:hypothetical protein
MLSQLAGAVQHPAALQRGTHLPAVCTGHSPADAVSCPLLVLMVLEPHTACCCRGPVLSSTPHGHQQACMLSSQHGPEVFKPSCLAGMQLKLACGYCKAAWCAIWGCRSYHKNRAIHRNLFIAVIVI